MADEAKAKGNATFSSGNYTEAIKHFTDAISLSPSNHVLFSNRSASHASLGQFSDALSDAQKTVELKPDWPKGYSRLGAAYVGLHNDAISAYKKGLELDPNNEALKSGLSDAQAADYFISSVVHIIISCYIVFVADLLCLSAEKIIVSAETIIVPAEDYNCFS